MGHKDNRAARTAKIVTLLLAALSVAGASDVAGVELKGKARRGKKAEASAVVWLEAPNAPATAGKQKAVLSQHNLTFDPHVLAIRVGTTVDFPNDDRVFHNVFSFHDGKKFDLGTYPVGSMKRVVFSKEGVSRIFCNIHPHMAGYVVAVDSPYFSAVEEDGSYTIPSVPPGKYTYHVWRPSGPMLTGTTEVGPDAVLNVSWP